MLSGRRASVLVHEELAGRPQTPENERYRNPTVGADSLSYHLAGNFGIQETNAVHILRVVEVVGGDTDVIQEVVCGRRTQVATVDVQGEEHDEDPGKDLQVRLAPDGSLFAVRPSLVWIKSVDVFVIVRRQIELGKAPVVENASFRRDGIRGLLASSPRQCTPEINDLGIADRFSQIE